MKEGRKYFEFLLLPFSIISIVAYLKNCKPSNSLWHSFCKPFVNRFLKEMNDIKFDTIIIIVFISEKKYIIILLEHPAETLFTDREVSKDGGYRLAIISYKWGISSNGRAPT